MKIYGIEKLSLVDFDGVVASTVFTGNCNFKCPFCHNSSLVSDYSNLPPISEDEIFSYFAKRKGILEGVCITGGEPTLNKDLPEFCRKIKDLGYKVKVDTNGSNPLMISTLIENRLADYFAMDIKNDKNGYGATIGIEKFNISNVEKSVEILMQNKVPYEFRTTLISEFHKEQNIVNLAEWIKGAEKLFFQKFRDGENCLTQGLHPVDKQTAELFKNIANNHVNLVKLRGYDN